MAIAMVYSAHNTTTIRFGFQNSKPKMEWGCWFVIMVCKDHRDSDGCTTKCMQHINTTISLQHWSRTSSFKDDHDDH
jgi:hypothetical protein